MKRRIFLRKPDKRILLNLKINDLYHTYSYLYDKRNDFHFLHCELSIYITKGTFQQNQQMEHISLSWFFQILRSHQDFLDRGLSMLTGKILKQWFAALNINEYEVIYTSRVLQSPSQNICLTNDHGYVLFVGVMILSSFPVFYDLTPDF